MSALDSVGVGVTSSAATATTAVPPAAVSGEPSAAAEEGVALWLIILIVILVLLCLCILLMVAFLLRNRRRAATAELVELPEYERARSSTTFAEEPVLQELEKACYSPLSLTLLHSPLTLTHFTLVHSLALTRYYLYD
jgi:TRAP-type C4-dicarboxylate transport system permease large subunit